MKQKLAMLVTAALLFMPAEVLAASVPAPQSESAIVVDMESGEVYYSKNAERRMYPASITKIVSGLLAVEKGGLDDTTTVSADAVDTIGTSVYLLEGEEMSIEQLVQGMVINSGNDAGAVLAEHYAEDEWSYAQEMTELVQEKAGAEQTRFANPHGLHHPLQYTTAADMAAIARYASENDTFMDIAATVELPWEGEGWSTVIRNHHRMIGNDERVTGLKNGFTSRSGYTLVTTAEQNGAALAVVTLNAETAQQSYDDTRALLDYGFSAAGRPETAFAGIKP
ncbi:D-alanyl-D-alanine carboxypeptidase family protein [Alkalicoccus luteus]|uniref:D-alanyl-D-alanine carboxypeptidase family protein n=1 Tax=Alkalicoccus luteus TaxID=1237094 RepID=UPI0040337D98